MEQNARNGWHRCDIDISRKRNVRSNTLRSLAPQNNLSKHGTDIKSDDRLAFYIPHELYIWESTSIPRTVKIHYGYLDSRGGALSRFRSKYAQRIF